MVFVTQQEFFKQTMTTTLSVRIAGTGSFLTTRPKWDVCRKIASSSNSSSTTRKSKTGLREEVFSHNPTTVTKLKLATCSNPL